MRPLVLCVLMACSNTSDVPVQRLGLPSSDTVDGSASVPVDTDGSGPVDTDIDLSGHTGTTDTGVPSSASCEPTLFVPDTVLDTPPDAGQTISGGSRWSVCAEPDEQVYGFYQRWWSAKRHDEVWCLITWEFTSTDALPLPLPFDCPDCLWGFSVHLGLGYEDGTTLCDDAFYRPQDLSDFDERCIAYRDHQDYPSLFTGWDGCSTEGNEWVVRDYHVEASFDGMFWSVVTTD